MMSGSREAIISSLISTFLARDVSQVPGRLNKLLVIVVDWEESDGAVATSSCSGIGERMAVAVPDKITAAPRVIPACPRINILL